jgi:hypothetical protein
MAGTVCRITSDSAKREDVVVVVVVVVVGGGRVRTPCKPFKTRGLHRLPLAKARKPVRAVSEPRIRGTHRYGLDGR